MNSDTPLQLESEHESVLSSYQNDRHQLPWAARHANKIFGVVAVSMLVMVVAIGTALAMGGTAVGLSETVRRVDKQNTNNQAAINTLHNDVSAILNSGTTVGGNGNGNGNGIGNGNLLSSACGGPMQLVAVINSTLPGAHPLDATMQRGRVRLVEDVATNTAVFFLPRNPAHITNACCYRAQATYPPPESGCARLPAGGMDVWDVSDPEKPTRLPSILTAVGTTTVHITRPVKINTPHFTGTILVLVVDRCSTDSASAQGAYIIDVTNPRAAYIRYGPFTVKDDVLGGFSDLCEPDNRHALVQAFSYSAGGRAFFSAVDACRLQDFNLPEPYVQFEITNPDAPVLLNYYGVVPLAPPLDPKLLVNSLSPPPIYWQTIYNEDAFPFTLDGTRPCIYNGAGTGGFEVACLENYTASNIPYFEHNVASYFPLADYIKPEYPFFKQAYSGGVSPDGKWSIGAHFDPGEIQPYFTLADSDPQRMNPHQICGTCRIKEGFCGVDGGTDHLRSGQMVCGRPVYLGSGCPDQTPIPLASSLDPSLLTEPGDVFIASTTNACYYGSSYAAVTLAGYNISIFSPDNTQNDWGGFPPDGCYTATIVSQLTPEAFALPRRGVLFVSSWFAFQTIWNQTLDSTQFPGGYLDNLDKYPPIGSVGQRICVNDWTSKGLYGYWHLMETDTQLHVGQWAPLEAQMSSPESLMADPNPAGGSIPAFDRRDQPNLVLVESGSTGLHSLRLGGLENDAPFYTPTVKYGLVEESYSPRGDLTNQGGDIGAFYQPEWLYKQVGQTLLRYATGVQRNTALIYIYRDFTCPLAKPVGQ